MGECAGKCAIQGVRYAALPFRLRVGARSLLNCKSPRKQKAMPRIILILYPLKIRVGL